MKMPDVVGIFLNLKVAWWRSQLFFTLPRTRLFRYVSETHYGRACSSQEQIVIIARGEFETAPVPRMRGGQIRFKF
jgi:hypothetical protein